MDYDTGSTSVSLNIQVLNDDGIEVTGQLAANFPAISWAIDSNVAATAFPTLNDLGSITAAYNPGGVFERGGGCYRLDAPNAMFANAGNVVLIGEATNFHVLCPPIAVRPSINSLLAAGKVAIVSPVSSGIDLTLTLVRGDDYATARAQALQWTDPGGIWPTMANGTTVQFVIRDSSTDMVLLSANGTVVNGSGNNKQVQVQLTSAQTATLPLGSRAFYCVQATLPGPYVRTLVGPAQVIVLSDATFG